jgi:hypothetical protein
MGRSHDTHRSEGAIEVAVGRDPVYVVLTDLIPGYN